MASDDPSKRADQAVTAPDPDEDDLDDLDDMLDEFSATRIDTKATLTAPIPPPPTTTTHPEPSGPGRPPIPTTSANPETRSEEEDAFAAQLQAGMANMLRELEQNPDMAKQFEEMMTQFGAPPFVHPSEAKKPSAAAATATATPSKPAQTQAASSASTPQQGDKDFQSTIRKTMERMKASSDSASAANIDSNMMNDDMMASLLKDLQAANGGEGGDGDDSFSKMLLGMMEQLTNKEILYEPMKDLDQKFPAWLEEKQGTLSSEDETRYRTQRSLVRDIVARFERSGYSDSNPEDREYIVEKMQKMQEAGAPPPDLVGDVNAASEMMGDMDAGCPQQ